MRTIYQPGRSNVLAENGLVATSHPLSSIEAISILKMGGNAIDAAIAASVVQSVVEPCSTGIGGDCFAIVSMNNQKPVSINGSGIAPKKASYQFFKKNNIKKIELTSPHSVTIPGSINAWYDMHKQFGKLEFEQLFITGEQYARNGYPVYEVVSKVWKENESKLSQNKLSKQIFLPNGNSPKFGELIKNIPLADTLKTISKKGADGFYKGSVVKDIVESLNALGGLHTEEDFAEQKTLFSDTIYNNYKNFYIHQCPLNGPGIIVLMMMALIERFDFSNLNPSGFERFHLQTEITKLCYEFKETKLGDPNFNKFEINKFLSSDFIDKLYNNISLQKTNNSIKSNVTSHPETIYLSVVDRDLNSVSFINSICHAFGSGITTNKSGILLQNRGVNFRLEENHPNMIDSHKKPLHTIIPGLLTDQNNNSLFCYGVMGGQYQPIGQCQVLQNIFDFNMSVQEAIDFPRIFNLNGKLRLEKTIPEETFNLLKDVGHNVEYVNSAIGGGQGIIIDRKKGVLIGGSDSRKDGIAIGY